MHPDDGRALGAPGELESHCIALHCIRIRFGIRVRGEKRRQIVSSGESQLLANQQQRVARVRRTSKSTTGLLCQYTTLLRNIMRLIWQGVVAGRSGDGPTSRRAERSTPFPPTPCHPFSWVFYFRIPPLGFYFQNGKSTPSLAMKAWPASTP